MRKIVNMIKQIYRLSSPYFFKSDDRIRGWMLLGGDLLLIIATVIATIRLNKWNQEFFNAMMSLDYNKFKSQLIVFIVIGVSMVIIGTYKAYIDMWLQIRWRKWMTSKYLSDWMHTHNHYRMQLTGNTADNPDQRISQDIAMFIQETLTISLGLLNSVLMLGSFLVILWNLSTRIPLIISGTNYAFNGYLIWICLLWSVVGTFVIHLVGKPLIKLNFIQQRFEADFRYSLVRIRENSEQVALLKGEKVEQKRLMDVFKNVIGNWFDIMKRRKTLAWFNGAYGQVNSILPSLIIAPAYFAQSPGVGFGELMQISMAFMTVLGTFSFFLNMYSGLAEWKAVINRLTGFNENVEKADEARDISAIKITEETRKEIGIRDLDVKLPDGRIQINAKDITVSIGDRALIKGPTGAGKTTLFRAISGIWPYGSGDIKIPSNANVMILPQQPYLPIGTLADAVTYPHSREKWSNEEIVSVLNDVGLGGFARRIDETGHWNHTLSGGEQQRVGIARALLHNPDFLFFDEATASMDEPSEAKLYTMLRERLKNTAIISIGHRSSLQEFHEKLLVAEMQDNGNFQLIEKTS
jgi:vitamin B12/bleomycin/antimicrobial peptide transport system ATP-binding/permease protein